MMLSRRIALAVVLLGATLITAACADPANIKNQAGQPSVGNIASAQKTDPLPTSITSTRVSTKSPIPLPPNGTISPITGPIAAEDIDPYVLRSLDGLTPTNGWGLVCGNTAYYIVAGKEAGVGQLYVGRYPVDNPSAASHSVIKAPGVDVALSVTKANCSTLSLTAADGRFLQYNLATSILSFG